MNREIKYDTTTRDFAAYLDNELVGFARSYIAAEELLNEAEHRAAQFRAASAVMAVNWGSEPVKAKEVAA